MRFAIVLAILAGAGCSLSPNVPTDTRPVDVDAAVVTDAATPGDPRDAARAEARPNDGPGAASDARGGNDASPDSAVWSLVWSDEFNGPAIDTTVWSVGDEFVTKNGELEYYRPSNAFIENGALVLEARQESYGGKDFTSGLVMSQGKKTFKYGRLSARIKLPATVGMWPAFWMLGATGAWPDGGELDIMESKGRLPGTVWGTAHWGPLSNGNHPNYGLTYRFPAGQDITGWHEYTLEWSATSLRWSVDGAAPYVTMVSRDPFNQDFYFILNLAVGGMFDNDVQPPRPMAPQRMLVDYVRVYACCR